MQDYDLTLNGCDPFVLLAAAIVKQAINDWYRTKAKKDELRRGSVAWERARCEQYAIEMWFLSEWCGFLTYDRGQEILDRVKRGEFYWNRE